MLQVYETSEVPNNQPSWCHYQMPPVVSHFFWWYYCLIKTHQSIQSIRENLWSFDCVLYTGFRAWNNRSYIWHSHYLQEIASLFGRNGSCVTNQAVQGCTKDSKGSETGVMRGGWSTFVRLCGSSENEPGLKGRQELDRWQWAGRAFRESVCIGWERLRRWDAAWYTLATRRIPGP